MPPRRSTYCAPSTPLRSLSKAATSPSKNRIQLTPSLSENTSTTTNGFDSSSPESSRSKLRRSTDAQTTPFRPAPLDEEFDMTSTPGSSTHATPESVNLAKKRPSQLSIVSPLSNQAINAPGTYVAPHRRPSLGTNYRINALEESGLPEPEDEYYSSPPSNAPPIALSPHAQVFAPLEKRFEQPHQQYANAPYSSFHQNGYDQPHFQHLSAPLPFPQFYPPPFPPPSFPPAYEAISPFRLPSLPFPPGLPLGHLRASGAALQALDSIDPASQHQPLRRSSLAPLPSNDQEVGRETSSLGFTKPSHDAVGVPTPIAEEFEDDVQDLPKVVVAGKPVVCSGCGTSPTPRFVLLQPCQHPCCSTCLTNLINSAAHSPPRPMKCFECIKLVESFAPAPFLACQSASIGPSRLSAHTTSFCETSSHTGTPAAVDLPLSSSRARAPSISAPHQHQRFASTPSTRSRSGTSSSIGGTPQLVRLSPFKQLDWSEASKNDSKFFTPEKRGPLPRSFDLESALQGSRQSPVPPEVIKALKKPKEWPVVRLDNVPWDVTVAEVEAWLPEETLAPLEECVLAVHILCNRLDGRTLNQAYLECFSVEAARDIVRLRDGKKLCNRPVHATISDQGELMSTVFPTWIPGFEGLEARPGPSVGPLLLQTELSGLIDLCRLDTHHSKKVKERPFFNIVTILQKFPWHQIETYNSKQIVRLFNTSCAAIETLAAIKARVPECGAIASVFADAVARCPVFRPVQKKAFAKKTDAVSGSPTPAGDASVGAGDVTNSSFFSPPSSQKLFAGFRSKDIAATDIVTVSPCPAFDPRKNCRQALTISKSTGIDPSVVAAIARELGIRLDH